MVAALIVALAGCDNTDSLNPDSSTQPEVVPEAVDEGTVADPLASLEEDSPVGEEPAGVELVPVDDATLASASFAGGIPFGTYHLPNSSFGSLYNGALRNIWPAYLLNNLAAIKQRGGKVVITLTGSEKNFKDASGRFSLTKWKALVNRFKSVNFGSYISDGTIIAHYLIDEPSDRTNWNGTVVSQATLEEMARYSKQIWPNMATVVRAYPDWLDDWSGSYRYLDAAWVQYVHRKGEVNAYMSKQLSAAKGKGLAVIVGLNVLRGGVGNAKMSATQVKSWGSVLLGSTYPCAFISWQYDAGYLGSSSMKSAMSSLRSKAENRSTKSCKGS